MGRYVLDHVADDRVGEVVYAADAERTECIQVVLGAVLIHLEAMRGAPRAFDYGSEERRRVNRLGYGTGRATAICREEGKRTCASEVYLREAGEHV